MIKHGRGSHWKYLALWGRVRKHYRKQGMSPKEADAMRHKIHVRALGSDKSSMDLKRGEFDKVFAHFLAILEPGNLEAQLRILDQPDQRRARLIQLARALVLTLPQIKAAAVPEAYATNYIDSLARRVRGKNFEDLDEDGMAVIYGILQQRIHPEPEEDGDPF